MGRPAGKGTVVITREWCKGCRICVDLCPEGVLGLDGQDKAVVLHPEACTACLFCELHCPDLAVEVQVLEPGVGEVQIGELDIGELDIGELEIGKRRKVPAEGPTRPAEGRA